MSTQEQEYTAEYQRKVDDFVSRGVVYCVSTLIHDLAQNDAGEYYDDILSVCVQDDWETPAYDAGWRGPTTDEYGATVFTDSSDGQTWCASNWQELCEDHNIEPYQNEAYEHWIVQPWLARKLEAKGEMVADDIHGLTVWGRCTSGQAISLDYVICKIYDELQAK